MSNNLVPDQVRHFVGPDLCKGDQQTIKVATCRQRVNIMHIAMTYTINPQQLYNLQMLSILFF